jgi:hypothetical protein
MSLFEWSNQHNTIDILGINKRTLNITKTGLPYFDTLRLYGAIDLYIGLQEEVTIHDIGNAWIVSGHTRTHFLDGRDQDALKIINNTKRFDSKQYCDKLLSSLLEGKAFLDEQYIEGNKKYDATLQDGIRGISAYLYETLQTGQTSKKECKAQIPLAHGVLAYAGLRRTEGIGNITFLPVFEGRIDLSKVISPLRAWIDTPNVLCSQALALLLLKTALFSDGYHKRLTAVVFNTRLGQQRSDNYSGLISIDSTAIGKLERSDFANHLYLSLRRLIGKAWKQGKATEFNEDAYVFAQWLIQPVSKHLSSLITSQEKMVREGLQSIFSANLFVREVFEMSYGNWTGDHDAIRKLARAVSSAIQWARGRNSNGDWRSPEEQRKKWYEEVSILRSTPTMKSFIERILILLEQGHREHSQIGASFRDENFDPVAIFNSVGINNKDFETFRDLFRMYLIQESAYKSKDENNDIHDDIAESSENNEGKEE